MGRISGLEHSERFVCRPTSTGYFESPLLGADTYTLRVSPRTVTANRLRPIHPGRRDDQPCARAGASSGFDRRNGLGTTASQQRHRRPTTWNSSIAPPGPGHVHSGQCGRQLPLRRLYDGSYRLRASNPGPTASPGIPADPARALRHRRRHRRRTAREHRHLLRRQRHHQRHGDRRCRCARAEVWVLARDANSSRVEADFTDGNGRYTIAVDPDGTHAVAFRPQGGPEHPYSGADGANVTVGPTGSHSAASTSCSRPAASPSA